MQTKWSEKWMKEKDTLNNQEDRHRDYAMHKQTSFPSQWCILDIIIA